MFGKLQMHEIRTIIIKKTGIDNILSPASLRTEVKKKEIPWSVQQCTKIPSVYTTMNMMLNSTWNSLVNVGKILSYLT